MTGMADKVTVLLRLPVPEGRIGDVVTVSSARAQMLVDSKYATFVSLADDADDEAPASSSDEPTDTSEEQPPAPVGADGPATELPAKSAAKAEWEAVAASLGVDTEGKTKDELIEAVTDIVG